MRLLTILLLAIVIISFFDEGKVNAYYAAKRDAIHGSLTNLVMQEAEGGVGDVEFKAQPYDHNEVAN